MIAATQSTLGAQGLQSYSYPSKLVAIQRVAFRSSYEIAPRRLKPAAEVQKSLDGCIIKCGQSWNSQPCPWTGRNDKFQLHLQKDCMPNRIQSLSAEAAQNAEMLITLRKDYSGMKLQMQAKDVEIRRRREAAETLEQDNHRLREDLSQMQAYQHVVRLAAGAPPPLAPAMLQRMMPPQPLPRGVLLQMVEPRNADDDDEVVARQ